MSIGNIPKQNPISDDELDNLRISRWQLNPEWDAIKTPQNGENWRLVLPFEETFRNSFTTMCDGDFRPHLHVAPRGQLTIYLNGTQGDEGPPIEVVEWVEKVGKYVAIKDLLAISFALDYTYETGNPDNGRTKIAELRTNAKPYEGMATIAHLKAAKQLADRCLGFLEEMTCYDPADAIIAIPPSNPHKNYNLPRELARVIAKRRQLQDLSDSVFDLKQHDPIKNTSKENKLAILRQAARIKDDTEVQGHTIILIDDLYQSGTTMNYYSKLLLDAGAVGVLGLACEKTCRNDDNVSGRR